MTTIRMLNKEDPCRGLLIFVCNCFRGSGFLRFRFLLFFVYRDAFYALIHDSVESRNTVLIQANAFYYIDADASAFPDCEIVAVVIVT